MTGGHRASRMSDPFVCVTTLRYHYSRCPASCKSAGTCPPPVPYGVGATGIDDDDVDDDDVDDDDDDD